MSGQPGGEFGGGVGKRRDSESFAESDLFGHVGGGIGVGHGCRTVGPTCSEEGVDEGVVDPCSHTRVGGVVGEPTVRGAAYGSVCGPDDPESGIHLGE